MLLHARERMSSRGSAALVDGHQGAVAVLSKFAWDAPDEHCSLVLAIINT